VTAQNTFIGYNHQDVSCNSGDVLVAGFNNGAVTNKDFQGPRNNNPATTYGVLANYTSVGQVQLIALCLHAG